MRKHRRKTERASGLRTARAAFTARACACALAGLFLSAAAGGGERPGKWHLERYRSRIILEVSRGWFLPGVSTGKDKGGKKGAEGLGAFVSRPHPPGKARVKLVLPGALSDGRNIRIVGPDGSLLPCKADVLGWKKCGLVEMSGAARRGEVVSSPEFELEFPAKSAGLYTIYWGKSALGQAVAAPAEERQAAAPGAGLTLTVWRHPSHRHPRGLKELLKRLSGIKEQMGSRGWPRIELFENPFGTDDRFIAVFDGFLFCRRSGNHTFALDSDDGAVLYVDGRVVVDHVTRAPHMLEVPTSKDPVPWGRIGKPVNLKAGLHRIACLLTEIRASQGVRAGWVTPGSRSPKPVVISESAFRGWVEPARRAFETWPSSLAPGRSAKPFFSWRIVSRTEYNKKVAVAEIELRAVGPARPDMKFRWQHGERTGGGERFRTFVQCDAHSLVSLSAVGRGYPRASYAEELVVPRAPDEEIRVDFELSLGQFVPAVYDDEPLSASVNVEIARYQGEKFDVSAEVIGANPVRFEVKRISVPREGEDVSGGGYASVRYRVAPDRNKPVTFVARLCKGGVVLDARPLRLLPLHRFVGMSGATLRVSGRHVVDGDGQPVCLVLHRVTEDDLRKWFPLKWVAKKVGSLLWSRRGPVLVVGDGLLEAVRAAGEPVEGAEPPGGETAGAAAVEESPGEAAELPEMLRRFIRSGKVIAPSLLFAELPRRPMLSCFPNLLDELRSGRRYSHVVISPGKSELDAGTPVREFERAVAAVVELAAWKFGRERIIVLAPAPSRELSAVRARYLDAARLVATDAFVRFVDPWEKGAEAERVLALVAEELD